MRLIRERVAYLKGLAEGMQGSSSILVELTSKI